MIEVMSNLKGGKEKMHEHEHGTTAAMAGKKFFVVTVLNLVITVVEIIGGVLSGSLALLSDAFHNLGDSLAIVLGYIAFKISLRGQNVKQTFGYKRAQILAAFINAVFLIGLSIFLIIEAVERFWHPSPLNADLMLIVAIVGLVANVASALLLKDGSADNLNQRATFLHILSDALSSVGVIIAGVLIAFFNWVWLDPLVTLLVMAYILKEVWPVLKQTIKILMQATPELDFCEIHADIDVIPGVMGSHHYHAWQVDEAAIMFSLHVNLQDMLLSDAEVIYDEINRLLSEKYNVKHVTIQAEVHRGEQAGMIDEQEQI